MARPSGQALRPNFKTSGNWPGDWVDCTSMSLRADLTDTPLPLQSRFVNTRFTGGILTIKMAGPAIGSREVSIIAEEVAVELDAIKDPIRLLVIDLSDVGVLSSLGLELCVDLRDWAHEAGAMTVLYGVSPDLLDLLKMMKTERLWQIIQDNDELRRALAA